VRYFPLTACIFLLTLMATPQIAHAAGNVLLPSTSNGSDSTAPNLGISPTSSPPTATNPPSVAPVVTPQAAPPAPIASPNSSALPQTSVPPAVNEPSDIVTSPVSVADRAKLPPGTMPTMVVHQADTSDLTAEATKDLPYGLTIRMSGQSIFGANDVQQITQKLGLGHDQVASSCILTVRGLLQTDKGTYIIDGGASPQVALRYDGVIKNYLMSGNALCAADPNLPQGSGFLTEIGGRYSLPLQMINCPAPNRQASQLMITYDGGKSAQCVYQ